MRSGGDSLLFDPDELAATLRVSARTLRRLDATGTLPRAVRVGNSKRWRRDEVAAWITAGCPRREVWDAREPATDARGGRRR